ncbi:MAG TPA: acyl-CoA dehydrogenase family protein [Myxococcota bacterium]|nr:acyl-CoA dehydrogenase family protein [Myxococcota bacterium]
MATSATTAARELAPLLTAHRDETERDRRLPAQIVERLLETRLVRMAIAQPYDGLEVPTFEALEVYEVLAAAEASGAWIVWNNSLPCLLSRFLGAAARAELFADARWLYANSTRPTGKAVVDGDGYRVSGRWSLVSGCELAEWIALACIVHDGDAPRMLAPDVPEQRLAYVRRGEVEILDTWHVGGLRGTGSHDVVVADVRVSHARTISPADDATLDRPIGRVPITCTMAAGFASQALGMAEMALRTLIALAGTKANVEAGPGMRDRPPVQALIARQTAALDAARSHLRRRTGELWSSAETGVRPSLHEISAGWAAAHHAIDAARTTLDGAYAAAGTTSLYSVCPLERAHRDLHAMLRHVVAQSMWLEDAGKVTLGMNPTHPLYAV